MSIRKKIFLLAGILLALFAAVVGTLSFMQRMNGEQINNIVNYEQPLSRLISEFDVDTDRYELRIMRVLRLDAPSQSDIEAAGAVTKRLTEEMRNDVAAIGTLLQQAIQDPRYRTEDRVDLARIDGSFKYIVRNLDGFVAAGDTTMGLLNEGKHSAAKDSLACLHSVCASFRPRSR